MLPNLHMDNIKRFGFKSAKIMDNYPILKLRKIRAPLLHFTGQINKEQLNYLCYSYTAYIDQMGNIIKNSRILICSLKSISPKGVVKCQNHIIVEICYISANTMNINLMIHL